MQLTIATIATAAQRSQPILEGIATDLGFVPNLAASMAESPTLLAAFDGMRRAVGACDLDPRLREVAGLAVGVAVDNAYGVAFHSTVLASMGTDATDLAAMRRGIAPADPSTAAVHDLARSVVLDRGKVDPSVIDAAADAGLTTTEILDVVAECLFASLVGTVDNLAERVELDEPFRPQAWPSS